MANRTDARALDDADLCEDTLLTRLRGLFGAEPLALAPASALSQPPNHAPNQTYVGSTMHGSTRTERPFVNSTERAAQPRLVTVVQVPNDRRIQFELLADGDTNQLLFQDAKHHPDCVKAHLIGLASHMDPRIVENPDDILYTISFTTTKNRCRLDALILPEEVVVSIKGLHQDDKSDIFFMPHDGPNISVTRNPNHYDPDDITSPAPGQSFVDVVNECPQQVAKISPRALFAAPSLRETVMEAHKFTVARGIGRAVPA